VREAFRWSATRRVTKTATVSLFANYYGVVACIQYCIAKSALGVTTGEVGAGGSVAPVDRGVWAGGLVGRVVSAVVGYRLAVLWRVS
jgi:hypothetical protein